MSNSCNMTTPLILHLFVILGIDVDLERLKLFVPVELGRWIPLVEEAFLAHILLDHFIDVLVISGVFVCYLFDSLVSVSHSSALFHLPSPINIRVLGHVNWFDNVFNFLKSFDGQVFKVLLQKFSELDLLQFDFFVLLYDRLISLCHVFLKLLDFLHLLGNLEVVLALQRFL